MSAGSNLKWCLLVPFQATPPVHPNAAHTRPSPDTPTATPRTPPTLSHLLKKEGGHLAVQRRLEGKVNLKGEPGGVRRGAQPAGDGWDQIEPGGARGGDSLQRVVSGG